MNIELRRQTLKLYYLIRKAHVRILDPRMRVIADPMLSQEFRLHMETPEGNYTEQFIQKWVEYYTEITSAESIEHLGRPMSDKERALLTQEQKESMEELKKLVNEY